VFDGLKEKPYSFGREKKRAYIAERNSPELITPAYETNVKYPIHCMTRTIKVQINRHFSKKFSL